MRKTQKCTCLKFKIVRLCRWNTYVVSTAYIILFCTACAKRIGTPALSIANINRKSQRETVRLHVVAAILGNPKYLEMSGSLTIVVRELVEKTGVLQL